MPVLSLQSVKSAFGVAICQYFVRENYFSGQVPSKTSTAGPVI
jgi:hypothetical protein